MLEHLEHLVIPKRENAQVQTISREAGLAWLAGIIDGEGNLDFSVKEIRFPDKNRSYFCPKLRITNTDMRMIKRISEIYVQENVVFFYALNSVKRYKNRKDTWKNQMEITISSQGSIKKLLELVLPHLVNKRDLAAQMIETIEWLRGIPRRGKGSPGDTYTLHPEFHAFMEKIKAAKEFHAEPSTTTRKAGKVLSW